MRRLAIWGVGVALLLLVPAVWFFPVGGQIWRADQVTRLAEIYPGERREIDHRLIIEEGVAMARADRFRWLLSPLVPERSCQRVTMELLSASGWVQVHLRCATGLRFDYISPDRWERKPVAPGQ